VMALRAGIEPAYLSRKPSVLTARRTKQIK
jgi:hypothetical protein